MLKDCIRVVLIFTLIAIGQSCAYEDEVKQHDINCGSATYVLDNNLNCTGG